MSGDDKYKGYYVGVHQDNLPENFKQILPKHDWYNDRQLNHQFLMYGLKYQRYSWQAASDVASGAYKVVVVDSLDDFISYVLARDLNTDLRELFNAKSNN